MLAPTELFTVLCGVEQASAAAHNFIAAVQHPLISQSLSLSLPFSLSLSLSPLSSCLPALSAFSSALHRSGRLRNLG